MMKRKCIAFSVVLTCAAALTGCGGDSSFDVAGKVSIAGMGTGAVSYAATATDGGQCDGTGPFGEFREGGDVVVLDADGTKLAVGTLSDGVLPKGFETGTDIGFVSCDFTFTVKGVKDAGDVYTIQIGDVVDETFTKAESSDLELSATSE